ncbi:helix-turn-helix domain-containing protein [Alicyclobacillus sp. SO9]|uniref:helix-turn-helix domain-containing protein n=1 Tax=Alicyclobacillus sp. SO9 TaxID=2665646 RepID=UPI0018E90704|nr:helix-turn-helix domain-containing protein [Alicyclobacillus sp. SO9]QQE80914.1 helix-turn-helix domain-containing protein [Alicyclobacillus sp. SO9]
MGKSKYDSHVLPKLDIIEGWSRNGLTLEQIAKNLHVSKVSLIKYRKEHVELLNALKSGKEEADVQVQNAIFRSAVGFHEKEQIATPSGKVVEVTRFHPPIPTAQIFWMKNRVPDRWRDKQQHEHSGPDGKPIEVNVSHDLSKLSDEELSQLEGLVVKSTVTPTDTS